MVDLSAKNRNDKNAAEMFASLDWYKIFSKNNFYAFILL